ncbi:hypothetical protein C1646_282823 [Rhizophagus diaphanus]|nr:hypothetical protein C1646_282823 [Rhizophagus diaphanus] [Rhizophagus sp. MUCL 43196]
MFYLQLRKKWTLEKIWKKWRRRAESPGTISSAIQERQASFPQHRLFTTNDCECERSHNLHRYPRGCSLLPLHDQLSPPKEPLHDQLSPPKEPLHDQLSPPKEPLHDQPSPPKERSQEKDKGIHIPEASEISFSASRTTSTMDNYDAAAFCLNGANLQKTCMS